MSAKTETIASMLRERVLAGDEPEVAARAVLGLVFYKKYRGDATTRFLPILVWEAQRVQRAVTRSIEVVVRESDGPIASLARQHLAERKFALPDGRYVEWSLATADDHRARAAWQRKLAGAALADAELHDRAAVEIEAAGVSCLAEIEERVA